jgi:hypothetical protein
MKEPLAMQEIHEIRRKLSNEWKNKSKKEIELEREKIRILINKLNLRRIEYTKV